MISSISTKTLISTIVFLCLCLIVPRQVFAQEKFIRVAAEEDCGRGIDLGSLSDGETVELEFRLVELMQTYGEEKNGFYFSISTPQKNEGQFEVKKINSRWCSYFYPAGGISYARNYFLDNYVKDSGLNNLKISFKNKWIIFRINDVIIGTLPVKDKVTQLNCKYTNIVFDYRWLKKPGNKSLAIPQLVDVGGGRYFETPQLFELNDGSDIRIFVIPLEVHLDSEWENSIAVYVGKSVTWLNHVEGNTFTASLDPLDDRCKLKKPVTLITGKENYFDIKRRKNKILVFINGKFLVSYVHHPQSGAPDPWGIHCRFVGYRIKYWAKKIK